MNYYDEFIRSVRSRSRFASDVEAVNTIRAVLEVLGRASRSVRPVTSRPLFLSI